MYKLSNAYWVNATKPGGGENIDKLGLYTIIDDSKLVMPVTEDHGTKIS